MAQIEVRNITDKPVTIREFYNPMRPGQVVVTERSIQQLQGMVGLQEALLKEEIAVAVKYTEAEKRANLISPFD